MDAMALQNAEFDAMRDLARDWSTLTSVAVVDDDYPEVRHMWEGSLRTFLAACKANGRSM